MGYFSKAIAKPVTDTKAFLRDATDSSGLKYVAEKGRKHQIYIPYVNGTKINEETQQEMATKDIVARSYKIHEWQTADGKFRATVCTHGFIVEDEKGNKLTDGSCPFCDRVNDAWEIVNYRKELEEANCMLTGDQRKNHLENASKTILSELKAKKARDYIYIVVAQYNIKDNNLPVVDENGVPEFSIKVMKMSAQRLEKIQQQVINAGHDIPGAELIIEYPNIDDRRNIVGQSTLVPVFPANMFINSNPKLKEKIDEAVSKFNWDNVEKVFPEIEGMTTMQAKKVTDNLFDQWDDYKQELLVNPNAKYLEYVVNTPSVNPSLMAGGMNQFMGGNGAPIPNIPSIPNMSTMGMQMPGQMAGQPQGQMTGQMGVQMGHGGNVPNTPSAPNLASILGAQGNQGGVQMPQMQSQMKVSGNVEAPILDPNEAFT